MRGYYTRKFEHHNGTSTWGVFNKGGERVDTFPTKARAESRCFVLNYGTNPPPADPQFGKLASPNKEGEQLRDMGITHVEQLVENEGWLMKAKALMRVYCCSAMYTANFTMDDIQRWFEQNHLGSPHHPNVYGALVRCALKRGYMQKTGNYVPSQRPQQHATMIPVYRRNEAL